MKPKPTNQAARYMTEKIMPMNRKKGCTCPYSEADYQAGGWMHQSGCPSSLVECLPNPTKLLEALRVVR